MRFIMVKFLIQILVIFFAEEALSSNHPPPLPEHKTLCKSDEIKLEEYQGLPVSIHEKMRYKCINLINEKINNKLRNAIKRKFQKLNAIEGFEEYLKTDATMKKVCDRIGTTTCDLQEYYDAFIDGSNPIYLLYHSEDERFAKKIAAAIQNIATNYVGAQLLVDIIIENKIRQLSDPVFIVQNDLFAGTHEGTIIQITGTPYQLTLRGTLTESAFQEHDRDQHGNIIFIKLDQLLEYSGFRYTDKLDTSKEYERYILRTISRKTVEAELDITLFHELNHYRHFLQGDYSTDKISNFEAIVSEISFHTNIDCMQNEEEELQLVGYNSNATNKCDVISENMYRYLSKRNLRFPYYHFRQGFVGKRFVDKMLENKTYCE